MVDIDLKKGADVRDIWRKRKEQFIYIYIYLNTQVEIRINQLGKGMI